jgi:cobalt-zinc-cadmium efflux system protein
MIVHARGHGPAEDFSRAFAIGVVLNLSYVVAQVLFGIFGHSLALLADAGHNFGDVLTLLLAWGASHLVKRPSTTRRTYGWRRSSIIAALFNALFLLITVGAITLEAVRRFVQPPNVQANVMIWVATIGVVINVLTALLFAKHENDLNLRAAFMHMAADAAVSAGVVVAGVAILFTGWAWLDPAASILINIVIVIGTWSLLRESFNLALDAVPENVDVVAVKEYLASLPEVVAVHDFHIWAMSTTEVALTAHLVMPNESRTDSFLRDVSEHLHTAFGIEHATIQIEQNAESCLLA